MLTGLAVVAKPMVTVLLTDKWLPSVPFLQISCLTVAFWPILGINVQAINAIGRSDVFMKMEIFNKGVALATLFATIPYGLIPVIVGQAAQSMVMCLVCYPWISDRYLGYTVLEQLRDILPALGCALGMGITILPLSFLFKNQVALLLCEMGVGMLVYALLCYLFKLKPLFYVLGFVGDKVPFLRQRFLRTLTSIA